MAGALAGRLAIVTGAGRGIGRAEAFALAAEGCRVVLNDIAAGDDPETTVEGAVAAIRNAGGHAEANHDDIGDWAGAQRLVEQALSATGQLDFLVCNAGNLRDRTLVNMSEEEWDAVIRVHLKGHFAPLHFAARHWRGRVRAGETVDARVILTSSEAGLYGNFGQVNYSSAKAGIAGMMLVAARELAAYGVRVNTICPRARTAMTEGVVPDMDPREGQVDEWDPNSIATFAAFLCGPVGSRISGQLFVVHGSTVTRMQTWAPLTEIRLPGSLTMANLEEAVDRLAGADGFALADFESLMHRSGALDEQGSRV